MTRLPVENWNIKPRLDLPPYELNQACPITGEVTGLESHHIVRKSFTALGREDNEKLYWVELDDGEVIGNRIRLSSQAHYRITTNRAAIVYANGVYYWDEAGEKIPMRWQPPTLHRRRRTESREGFAHNLDEIDREQSETEKRVKAELATQEKLYPKVESAVEPGHDCPTCNRRVPLPKKASSPSTKVFSTRVPVDDAESFDELIESLARHFGVSSKPHHKFWAIHYAAVAALQDEALKDALNG